MNFKNRYYVVNAANGGILSDSLEYITENLYCLDKVSRCKEYRDFCRAEHALLDHLEEIAPLCPNLPTSIELDEIVTIDFKSPFDDDDQESEPDDHRVLRLDGSMGTPPPCYAVVAANGIMLAPSIEYMFDNLHQLHGRYYFSEYHNTEAAKDLLLRILRKMACDPHEVPSSIQMGDIIAVDSFITRYGVKGIEPEPLYLSNRFPR